MKVRRQRRTKTKSNCNRNKLLGLIIVLFFFSIFVKVYYEVVVVKALNDVSIFGIFGITIILALIILEVYFVTWSFERKAAEAKNSIKIRRTRKARVFNDES